MGQVRKVALRALFGVTVLISFFVAAVVGVRLSVRSGAALATPRPVATPTVSTQVRRAAMVGPGYLDYCPTHNGRAPARYDITVPGAPRAGGWCQTEARRGRDADTVTFRAHWEVRGVHGRSGTFVMTYRVPKKAQPRATPVVVLETASGQPPP